MRTAYLEFKVDSYHPGQEVPGYRLGFVTLERPITERKIVSVTKGRERRGNKRNSKKNGRGTERRRRESPEQNFGVHHDSGKGAWVDKVGRRARGSRINTMRLSVSLSLPPSSNSLFVAPTRNATQE